jgi:hypothetical protein
MSLHKVATKKIERLISYLETILSKEEILDIKKIIYDDKGIEEIKPFDPIAGSGGSSNYSRFYANNLENSVPTFSDGPYLSHEDDNYFRGLPHFTNTFEQG